MAGRPRKPTRLKELAGTDQPCRSNPDEPRPDPSVPSPPAYIIGSALEEWRRITPELDALGIISQLDMAALASYCCAYGVMADAMLEWQQGGSPMTTKSANGIEMVHPLLTICNQSREQTRKLANELGVTPASRSKVSGKKKEPEKRKRLDFL